MKIEPKIKNIVKPSDKPDGKIKIDKIFTNSRNGQMTIFIPKRQLKNLVPSRIELSFWGKKIKA